MPFLGPFGDVLPRALLAAIGIWAAANYFVIGPELGSRVARADHVPACEANFRDMVRDAAREKHASIPLPTLDPMQEYAIRQGEQLLNSPLMQWAQGASRGMGEAIGIDVQGGFDAARRTYAANKRAAEEAYRLAKEEVRAWGERQAAAAGDVCGCLAEMAVNQTRADWAMFSGSLTLIEPEPVVSLPRLMAQLQRDGACKAEAE